MPVTNPKTSALPNSQTPKTPDFSKPVEEAKRRVQEAREKLQALEQRLNSLVVGREDVVRALMLALVSRQHIVMLGPPGTAKSYLALALSRLLNARFYSYLMTRFTNYDELIGPLDVVAFAQRGELKRRWSKLLEADIGFLDEIFKASSPILNALLSLMQERQIYDPITGQAISANLWTLIAASNETPAEEELQALYDRFAIKIFMDYINNDEKILAALAARWQSTRQLTPVANMEDVKTLHDYAVLLLSHGRVQGTEMTKLYYVNVVPFLQALRSRGIVVSDRYIIEKAALLYAAHLVLYGLTAENIVNAVYDIAPYIARTPQELNDIRKIIEDALGEVAELAKKLQEGERLLASGNRQAALKVFMEVATYDVSKLTSRPWLKPRVEAAVRTAMEHIKRLQEP